MAHARDAARTYGKSDPIDALAVARAALRQPGPANRTARRPSSRATPAGRPPRGPRRRAHTLHQPACAGTSTSSTRPGTHRRDRCAAASTSTPSPHVSPRLDGPVARIAGEIVDHIRHLTVRETALEREITALVADQAPTLLAVAGVGALTAAKIVAETADVTPLQVQGRLRPPQRHRTVAGLVRQPRTTPPLAYREPSAQRRDPSHRHHPDPLPRRRQGLHRPPPRQRQHQDRSTPGPQTPPLRRRLPRPARRRPNAAATCLAQAA